MFLTIWPKKFFCVKSHMGTPLDSIFLSHKKKYQLQVWAYLAVQIKKKFGTMEDLMIWFDLTEKKYFLSKVLWEQNSIQFFHTQIDPKVASYWLVSSTLHYNCIRCLSVYRIAIEISINLNIIRVIWHLVGDKSERTSLRFESKIVGKFVKISYLP